MSSIFGSYAPSHGSWSRTEGPIPPPITFFPSEGESAAAPWVDQMERVWQGPRDSGDHLADNSASTVQNLSTTVYEGEASLRGNSDPLRAMLEARSSGLFSVVGKNPLASLAIAFALGVMLIRSVR